MTAPLSAIPEHDPCFTVAGPVRGGGSGSGSGQLTGVLGVDVNLGVWARI